MKCVQVDPLALMGSLMGAMMGGAGAGQFNNQLASSLAMAGAIAPGVGGGQRGYDRDRRDRQVGGRTVGVTLFNVAQSRSRLQFSSILDLTIFRSSCKVFRKSPIKLQSSSC